MKKVLLSLGALAAVMIALPMFSAFEAHVINVTAAIENALSVPVTPISFGTVFPQEHLNKKLPVTLSQSFMDERDANDVEYIIRQKPKCGVTSNNGTVLVGPTWTGHVVVEKVLENGQVVGYTHTIDCEQDRPATVETPGPYLLPSLCEYISKHPDGVNDEAGVSTNDGSLNSFHKPFTINQQTGAIVWNDTRGRLAKSDLDTKDTWTIDLAVPCFGGFCAQDWLQFVRDITGNQDMTLAQANEFVQSMDNEHKVFGCNLWVEVTGVSRVSGQNSGTSIR